MTRVTTDRTNRFSLRALLASVGFVAIYIALAIPNFAAFRDALSNPAFGIISMSRQYSITWLAVVVCTAILLPPLIQLQLKTPALIFIGASACTMALNYILPVGML